MKRRAIILDSTSLIYYIGRNLHGKHIEAAIDYSYGTCHEG